MSLRQSGINPLGYLGVEPVTVAADVSYPRDPTPNDSQNFQIMTRWLNTTNMTYWVLVSLAANVATWIELAASGVGSVLTITGNFGGPIGPDVNGNINLIGTDGAIFTGTTNSETLSFNYLTLPATTAGGNGIITLGVEPFINGYGTNNTFIGPNAGNLSLTVVHATGNTALGATALSNIATGADNIALGFNAGSSYTSESSNIVIGNTGTITESNVIRIGTQGGGAGQQNTAFMAGIYNVTPSGSPIPVVINSNGQLGTGGGTGFAGVAIQTFTTTGTYTPTAGMEYAIIEVVGAGGGGGGCDTTNANQISAAGGGGGGGYARGAFTAAAIGASQAVTIGAGGAGGAAGPNDGSAGTTTSVGVLISATGGAGGLGAGALLMANAIGGAGGAGTGGNFQTTGTPGGTSSGFITPGTAAFSTSGSGGSSFFGGGGMSGGGADFGLPGENGHSYGGGGAGAANGFNFAAAAGGTGANGFVVITEFIN